MDTSYEFPDINSKLLEPFLNICCDTENLEISRVHANEVSCSTKFQESWIRDGLVIIEGLLPDSMIDDYKEEWLKDNREDNDRPGGWDTPCPFMNVRSLLKIATYQPIHDVLKNIIGEPVGVNLALTGWKSTERCWHQDTYLNPEHVKDWYAAAWVALSDIHRDSGPFEFIRGSHRLPPIDRDKLIAECNLSVHDPFWPKKSEIYLSPIINNLIEGAGLTVESFTPQKGDVLFWHSRLLHRGTKPQNPTLWREALILHYSGIYHRPDMPPAKQYDNGGWYFPIEQESGA